MKYTADTGFFIRLSQGHPRALAVWDEIVQDKGRLVIPAAVLIETSKDAFKKGKGAYLEKVLSSIAASGKISALTSPLPLPGTPAVLPTPTIFPP